MSDVFDIMMATTLSTYDHGKLAICDLFRDYDSASSMKKRDAFRLQRGFVTLMPIDGYAEIYEQDGRKLDTYDASPSRSP